MESIGAVSVTDLRAVCWLWYLSVLFQLRDLRMIVLVVVSVGAVSVTGSAGGVLVVVSVGAVSVFICGRSYGRR